MFLSDPLKMFPLEEPNLSYFLSTRTASLGDAETHHKERDYVMSTCLLVVVVVCVCTRKVRHAFDLALQSKLTEQDGKLIRISQKHQRSGGQRF